MALLIGALLALAVAAFAVLSGFGRSRSFYPTVLVVVGGFYVLFALIAGRPLGPELVAFAVFAGLAVLGFRLSPWIVVLGLVGHGLFDLLRGGFLPDAGAPPWWPMFCGAYDVVAGLVLALLLWRGAARRAATAPSTPL
jgi:hypothetical protein